MESTDREKLAYSMADVRQSLGISQPTLYELINNGELRTYTIGRRRFTSAEALRAFIRARERGAA